MTASPAAETTTLPVYAAADVPAHLRTKTELKAERLKVAPGQEPLGFLRKYRSGHGWGEFPLYDPAGAEKMRPLSAKQQRAKDARRTCPECGTLCSYIVHVRCEGCRARAQQEAQDRQARTCHRCRRESGAALPKDVHGWSSCEHCRVMYALRRQLEQARYEVWSRTCPGYPGHDCTVQTMTGEEITASKAAGTWWGPDRCPECDAGWDRWDAEQRRQAAEDARYAEERRKQQVRDLSAWAAEALADPSVVVLDTETTGLEDDARIVDLAVVTSAGDVLLDTLINPGVPIPDDATAIHGITDTMVQAAPAFGSILTQLATVLEGRRCLIYNKPYDVARLRHELTLHYRQEGHPEPAASADAWLETMRFEDAMIPYSDWVGDWSDYWGNNTWRPPGVG